MGLISAGLGAIGGTLADQWKEFFYCDAMDKNVLMVKGQKRVSGRSSNTKGNDNIISNGSVIAVADGQCMMIVEQGKIVEVCAEPGEFVYDTSTEPSIFYGKLGKGILDLFKTIGKRWTFGGDPGKDQRVYYFNLKEIMENKFGTANPIPFRIVDSNLGLDLDVSVRCAGIYSYRITNPLLFYTNVCANVTDRFTRDQIDMQLKSEFIDALQPAFGALSAQQIRPNELMNKDNKNALKAAINEELSPEWAEKRGIEVFSLAFNSVTLPEEDQELIKQAQRAAMLKDPNYAAATIAAAQADAMKDAAKNQGGAMAGFMGMGMAMNAGSNAANLFAMGQQQPAQPAPAQPAPAQPAPAQPAPGGWTCACGTVASGNFCPNCGTKKPEEKPGWTCSCGSVNQGNFCPNCGSKRPAAAPLYRCDKCGWQPEDPANPPAFCPECGDRFTDDDKVQ